MPDAPELPALGEEPSYLESGLWERGADLPEADGPFRLNPTLSIANGNIGLRDPVTGVDSVFRVDRNLRGVLGTLADDPGTSTVLPVALLDRLIALGVLIDEGDTRRRRRSWNATVSSAREQFGRRGYVSLPRLLSPVHIAWLRNRYRRQVREAALARGDTQCPTRWIAHNEPAARTVHSWLTRPMSAVVGRPLRPSYAYLGCYEAGSILPEHTDRAQCEYSITMLIDYLPEPDGPSPWPIYLRVDGGAVAVHQHVGDALLYRGTQLPHFRNELPAGQMSTSIFFHFVDEGFQGALD